MSDPEDEMNDFISNDDENSNDDHVLSEQDRRILNRLGNALGRRDQREQQKTSESGLELAEIIKNWEESKDKPDFDPQVFLDKVATVRQSRNYCLVQVYYSCPYHF